MISYQSLANVERAVLHSAFVEAFSDYQVKIDLPIGKFEQMLQRRGYSPQASIGAFDGEALVGFVLNGLRSWAGRLTAYDLGTGVIPAYRRQGLTSAMLEQLKPLLREKQVEQYLLEVLKDNSGALALYEKQGFQRQRGFACMALAKDKCRAALRHPVAVLAQRVPQGAERFWDGQPSWQNSPDSIRAVADAFHYAAVYADGAVAGYGVIDTRSGDIPQLAVAKNQRGKGIGESLLAALAAATEADSLRVLNVDETLQSTLGFLAAQGFQHTADQYEMLLAID